MSPQVETFTDQLAVDLLVPVICVLLNRKISIAAVVFSVLVVSTIFSSAFFVIV